MNGVRRFLGAAASLGQQQQQQELSHPSPPLSIVKNSNPSSSQPPSSPVNTTSALLIRKHSAKPSTDTSSESRSSLSLSPVSTRSPLPPLPLQLHQESSPVAGPSTSPIQRPAIPRVQTARKPVLDQDSKAPKYTTGVLNIRDELIFSLLASEAVVASTDFQILSAEEVEDLKKEQHILSTRLNALNKKLTLETRIRDAAVSLSKVNQSTNKKIAQKSVEQLEAANKRVDSAQKEFWQLSERANEVHRKLVEHRAGVLSWSVKNMERKVNPMANGKGKASLNGVNNGDSGYDSPLSPTSSISSANGNGAIPLDGFPFFAGHANTTVPSKRSLKDHASLTAEVCYLEANLKAATASLAEATKKQGEMARELNMLRLEKEEVETMLSIDLQNAQETIAALEKELPALEGLEAQFNALRDEKVTWEAERSEWEKEKERRGEESEKVERAVSQEKEEEINHLKAENRRLEDDISRLRYDNENLLRKAGEEIDEGIDAIQDMVQKHSIPTMFTRRESSTSYALLLAMVDAVDKHLTDLKSRLEDQAQSDVSWQILRRKLEEDVRLGLDKREALSRELEEARREREEARRENRELETKLRDQQENSMSMSIASSGGASPPSLPSLIFPSASELANDSAARKIIAILQPIWAILPSPEARAAQSNAQRSFRAGGSPGSPSSPGSPGFISRELSSTPPKSIAELDVRSLKILYDSRTLAQQQQVQQPFSLEGLVARVQALVADDRALIARLLRFAHAHDMLKKNAERAQKLAQESNVALETYQKQVRVLEDMVGKGTVAQDELHNLYESIERISAEKAEIETEAAKQTEICKQLTEANDTLSARALALADEAAAAPEKARQQLEVQLNELKKALDASRDEVEALRRSEQNQGMMLMDELNAAQTENDRLREQLRALKR
ncbi:hypothetical protein E1B28_004755 [Marasmius oreades]|uniref:Up-regulated during septation protein 1 domain-containing protein n=1 Tax=Marasmius oreades TaxID=181124 RepID=A0A9P7UZ92_9AGAR|nr:uncharacterized protein E1B28_004755 [Marasmius oreades]KAG7097405.1 hypothetical protein E1B28_004755 [Marasmius oreades]